VIFYIKNSRKLTELKHSARILDTKINSIHNSQNKKTIEKRILLSYSKIMWYLGINLLTYAKPMKKTMNVLFNNVREN
jgi:hypothetical protein